MGRFDEFKARMEETQREMQEYGKKVFKEESAALFADNPDLVSYRWTQYTPYFNDGDECVFSVHDYIEVTFSDGEVLQDWDGSDWDIKDASKSGVSEENIDTACAAVELVRAIPEEVMKAIFGDHVEVTIFSDHVEVEEYEHE